MSNESLTGNSGDLFYIDITSDATFEGPATIDVKGILFTRAKDRKEIAFEDASGIADTHASIKGDANSDGSVDAADIVEVINYLKGSPSEKFDDSAADANDDTIVNTADIVKIVNIIMGN